MGKDKRSVADAQARSLVVYKYGVWYGKQSHLVPKGAEILSFGFDGENQLAFWALCDYQAKQVERVIQVLQTGEPVKMADPVRYIGTVNQSGMVFHAFDLGERE